MADEATQTATEVAPVEGDPDATPSVEPDDSVTPQHWSRGEGMELDDDTIGWLENKGFENPQAAITSQRELEKKMGGPPEMLQKWPEADDTEGFKAIYQRLGTPKDVEGYKVEFEEGAAVDADTLTWLKETALKHNMTNAMTQGIALDWNTEVARLQAEQQEALGVQNETEKTELRVKWGTKYEERLDYGHRALIALGVEDDDIDSMEAALGPKKLAQIAAKMADTMGEDTIAAHTDTPAFGTSEEQVQNSINELTKKMLGDPELLKEYQEDHGKPKEGTGKTFRRMQQLDTQLIELKRARLGKT